MAKEDKIIRFPRPLGTTAMILEYQKSGNPEDLIKVQNYLINQWLLGNGVLCGVTYDINSFSNRLGIDTEYVRIFMRDRLLSSKIWDKDKQEELLQALMGEQLAWAKGIIDKYGVKGWYQGDNGSRYYFTPEGEMLRNKTAVIGENKYSMASVSFSVFGLLYVGIGMISLLMIRHDSIYMSLTMPFELHNWGTITLWLLLFTTWASDTFAYFSGRAFGKRKKDPPF